MARTCRIERKTSETQVKVELNLDGEGKADIKRQRDRLEGQLAQSGNATIGDSSTRMPDPTPIPVAQRVEVYGWITDADTGQGIPGALFLVLLPGISVDDFEWSEEDGRWYSRHHPFTMPIEDHVKYLPGEPGKVEAQAYDLVLDGNEIAGGSIRIHRSGVQQRMFQALGFTAEESREKFGFLLDAFRYGTPPHGGIAFGFDRLAMILLGCDSIRDVIAFPKTTSGLCLMTESPNRVDDAQLEELGIGLTEAPEEGKEGDGV